MWNPRAEKIERPERAERAERAERVERAERSDRSAVTEKAMKAYLWKWRLLERAAQDSCSRVAPGEERPALQLFNPRLTGPGVTTDTLVAAVQILRPGEVAHSNEFCPSAVRFILQGNGVYAAVRGEKIRMREGDLLVTRSWQWPDHVNDSGQAVAWMDGFDVPFTTTIGLFFDQQAADRPTDRGHAPNAQGRLAPTWVREPLKFSPLMLYSWEQTREVLSALRNRDGSPYEGIALDYAHPQTGGPLLPSIGCRVQLIRAGERLKAHRVMGSAVFHVVQGQGHTVIEGRRVDWEKGDIVSLPSWALHEHANTASQDAILFSINDRPVIQALGFYREEALVENGGHQRTLQM